MQEAHNSDYDIHKSRVKNQLQHNARKLLKEEGLSEIENELSKLNSKYSSSKQERPS
jgi:hypothetical protein